MKAGILLRRWILEEALGLGIAERLDLRRRLHGSVADWLQERCWTAKWLGWATKVALAGDGVAK